MAVSAARRIHKEIGDIIKSEKAAARGIQVEMIYDDDDFDLRGEIEGPLDTPYEGGTFVLKIEMPRDYPIKPPKITFVTKIWHPNVCLHSGFIGLDILQKEWSTSLTLRTILLSIQVLLSSPKPDVPQDLDISEQFLKNPEIFDLTARYWTHVYASGPYNNQSFEDKVAEVIQLIVSEDDALEILSEKNWDLEEAIKEVHIIKKKYQYGYDSK